MTDNMTCGSQHQQLLDWLQKIVESIGKHEAHITTSLENQQELFDRLHALQSTLDRRADLPDKIQTLQELGQENRKYITQLQSTITNGLTERTKRIENTVELIQKAIASMQLTETLKDIQERSGILGYISQAWADFQKKSGPIVIGVILALLAWAFITTTVFHEIPFKLLGGK